MVDLFEPHAKNDVKNEALVHMKGQLHKKVILNNKVLEESNNKLKRNLVDTVAFIFDQRINITIKYEGYCSINNRAGNSSHFLLKKYILMYKIYFF